MSNQEKLQDAMNFLDEKIIAEAEPEAKVISVKKRFPWKAVVGIAATLVIVAGATIAFTITRSDKTAEMDSSGNSYTPKGKE